MRFHHLYYSEGDGGGQVETKPETTPEVKPQAAIQQPTAKQPETVTEPKAQTETRQQPDAGEFADALMKALEDRTSRAEKAC